MAYYLEYNGIDLTDLVGVRSVEMPALPSMSHSSIDMFERDGNVYNGLSFGNREIKLTFLVKSKDPEEYELKLSDAIRAFYTKEEAKLYCGDEEYYMWCVPTGDMTVTELTNGCSECEVNLIAYDPYWYSDDYIMDNNNGKKFTVKNECDLPVYPVISVGFSGKDSDADEDKNVTFVQLENQTNGERILIGSLPSVDGEVTPAGTKILTDKMESSVGWESTSISKRDCGAGITLTENGDGLCCINFGSKGDYQWHGACFKKSIKEEKRPKNFSVRVRMKHNSTGKNGDPSHPFQNDYTSSSSSTSTSTTYYYQVTPSVGLRLRKGASTSTAKICTMPKGTKLYYTKDTSVKNRIESISNGWAKTVYNGKSGYCYTQYLKKYTSTKKETTGTDAQCNFATVKATAIRTTYDKSSKNKETIPVDNCIRVYTGTKYCKVCKGACKKTDKCKEENLFYKLAKTTRKDSKGNTHKIPSGYVLISNLVKASEYTVDYEYELETADDKTGICEIYGYSDKGNQLFCMGMYDDNEYYEFTYPLITRNGEEFVKDKTTAPNAKTSTERTDDGKKVDKVLSGRYGDWNEFYGELYIERKKNVWKAYVKKIKDGEVVKEIPMKTKTDKTHGDELLSYLVIYMGTSGDTDKASGMAISHIEVKTLSDIDNEEHYTPQPFLSGDIVDIHTDIPAVYLNMIERNDLIDVGSSFFALEPGDNVIKVKTDDQDPNIDIMYKPKRL